ncbi:hypothetical protein, partial [Hydrogenophaga sp. 5NK40-0174]|uniref:hypothetical protein n=1 Tax=Hydrogenophaga sp. 5NK40-0174 TaxID=3127649 RepID=UPI003342B2E0
LLLDAPLGGYVQTNNLTHLARTHDSSSREIFNEGFHFFNEKPAFIAAQDPYGGATAFFAFQSEEAMLHLQHLGSTIGQIGGGTLIFTQQRFDGSVSGSRFGDWLGSHAGKDFKVGYVDANGRSRTFNLRDDPHFQYYGTVNGLDMYDRAALDKFLAEDLRNATQQHQIGQAAAASIDFNSFETDKELFLQGLNLYSWTDAEGDRLLKGLYDGSIKPGHPEYEKARAVAEQAFREAYAHHAEYETQLKFNKESAHYQAQRIDLSGYDVNDLFHSGVKIFRK